MPASFVIREYVRPKYADHLPLYRLEHIFERHGVQITLRTLSEWSGAVADLLEPIVRAVHREQVCQSPWIQCDDTTLDVQDPTRAPEIRTGHLWVYRGEGGEVVYDFTWSRNRDGPMKMLTDLLHRRCSSSFSRSAVMTPWVVFTSLTDSPSER